MRNTIPYNIVLLPDGNTKTALVKLATEQTLDKKPNYKLSEEKPPHISVFQFVLNEKNEHGILENHEQLISEIFEKAKTVWDEIIEKNNSIIIKSKEISSKKDTIGPFAGTTWVEIKINKQINPQIQAFHEVLLKQLIPIINPCNAHGDRYNPHFTIFNTKDEIPAPPALSDDTFKHLQSFPVYLAIGRANSQWELVDTIYSHQQANSFKITI